MSFELITHNICTCGRVASSLRLNLAIQTLVGSFGRNHVDSTACRNISSNKRSWREK